MTALTRKTVEAMRESFDTTGMTGSPTDQICAALLAAWDREAKLREAVQAEIAARNVYEDLPTDRGGSYGPKGRAYAKWLDARADVMVAAGDTP